MIHIEKDFNQVPDFLQEINSNSEFEYSYNIRKKLRSELENIYQKKCAYCESKIYERQDAHIENYRPKSKYRWLSYEWSNLLLACNTCNRYKEAKFKIEGNRITQPQKDKEEWKANSKSFLAEKPLLLHPEIDYPENQLYFTNDGYIHADDDRGKYTIETCNLNRESLIARRQDILENFFKKLEYLLLLVNKGLNAYEIIKIADPIFKDLQQSNDKSNEFSLLYKNMLENFSEFFLLKFTDKQQKFLMQIYHSTLKSNFFSEKNHIENFLENSKLIDNPSANFYKNKQKILPYAIKQLQVENFHGIIKTGFENIPIDTQWIFLTGENGFGKTTILQSLVLGLYGNQNNSSSVSSNIAVEFIKKGTNQINTVGANEFVPFKDFVAYGSSRLNILESGDTSKTTESSQTYSIFNSDGYLLNIEYLLTRYALRDKIQFEKMKNIFCTLMPHIKDIEVVIEGRVDVVYYIEKDEEGNSYKRVKFEQLASGYRSIIAMFGDMIMRLSERQDINSPSDLAGIVIIDELDLHFHPNWQKKLPKLLSDTFPKIQFIVSTHSVIPFLGALENSIFLKVTRDEENGVKLHKLDIDIKNLLPNTILTSPIFDFEKLIPSSNQKIEDIRTEDLYNEAIFNQIVDEKLKNIAKSGSSRLDNLFGD